MSLRAVTRKEFQDSIRSFSLLGLTLLFTLFAGWLTALQFIPMGFRESAVNPTTLALLNSMRQPTLFFVPLVGLALGYNSIIGERETGTIKVILGLPNTRNEVVLGKFVGRGAVLLTAILVSYMAVGLTALALYDSFSVWIFATYTVLTVLYGLVYITIGIALSASVDSQIRAFSTAGFFYGLFLLVWDVFVAGIATATVGYTLPQTGGPPWLQALFMLNPSTAFAYATRAVIPEYREISILFDPTAFYLQDWVGFIVLALWITVPLALGYQRFNTDDLR
jgi:ABC-2 type transport system permease protein